MKYARVINDIAVDVVTTDPFEIYHPTLATEFIQVASHVLPGSKLVENVWLAPEIVPETPLIGTPSQMAIIDFLRLFTQAELVGFNTLRKQVAALGPDDYTDPDKALLVGFEVGLTHYDALRAGLIELDHPETVQWLSLLVPLGVLTEARLPQVLAGQAPE